MTPTTNNPFGEVVASSLKECSIQSWTWKEYPSYGSFITIQDNQARYAAIIHAIETIPFDSSRTPVTYKKTHDELIADHPHIFSLLKTVLRCTLLGTHAHNTLDAITKPAHIHSFSTLASEQEINMIIHTPHYVHTIMNYLDTAVADNLIYAFIAHQKQHQFLTAHQFKTFLKEYLLYVGNDYKRINALNTHL